MALPRYLQRKFSASLKEMSRQEELLAAMCAGADYGELVFDVLNTVKKKKFLRIST